MPAKLVHKCLGKLPALSPSWPPAHPATVKLFANLKAAPQKKNEKIFA